VTIATNLALRLERRWTIGSFVQRNRGTLISIAFFLALFVVTTALSPRGLTYFSVTSLLNAGAALALAAIGQTFVILCGDSSTARSSRSSECNPSLSRCR
jgi:hypothetical protein